MIKDILRHIYWQKSFLTKTWTRANLLSKKCSSKARITSNVCFPLIIIRARRKLRETFIYFIKKVWVKREWPKIYVFWQKLLSENSENSGNCLFNQQQCLSETRIIKYSFLFPNTVIWVKRELLEISIRLNKVFARNENGN